VDKRAIFSTSSSSNWGIESVDVFAPGVELPALGTLYGGTSGATPIVAGIVAMYRTQNPGKLAAEVVDDVVLTASPRSALNGLCVSWGIVDAAELFGLTGCP
jgi:subtilisin family serine protease